MLLEKFRSISFDFLISIYFLACCILYFLFRNFVLHLRPLKRIRCLLCGCCRCPRLSPAACAAKYRPGQHTFTFTAHSISPVATFKHWCRFNQRRCWCSARRCLLSWFKTLFSVSKELFCVLQFITFFLGLLNRSFMSVFLPSDV